MLLSLPRTGAAASAIAILLWASAALAQTAARYPGAAWDEIAPAQSGWSSQRLDAAKALSQQIGSSAVVVVQHGAIVASWGDTHSDMLLNSARKSLLSALIGIAAANGKIQLTDTLARLVIDDNPPALTPSESAATVRDLLEARSGIYHDANYETTAMRAKRPPRGSHPPGTFWYYNNWDFNALGAIYEHAAGVSVFEAFARQIAAPIGMQDFDPAKCRYFRGQSSLYPAYLFYASARDLARFGLLYLRHGRWRDLQVIPAAWIDDSTRSYSTTDIGSGYGYLWWTIMPNAPSARISAPPGSYFAQGNGGQYVFVIPQLDFVVVHLVESQTDRNGERGVTLSDMSRLLAMILAAAPNP